MCGGKGDRRIRGKRSSSSQPGWRPGSALGHMKAMEELLRPLAYQGGKCVPRALMMGIKLASEELSSRSGSRGGASASSAGWCCNSRAIARGNCRACVAARAFL